MENTQYTQAERDGILAGTRIPQSQAEAELWGDYVYESIPQIVTDTDEYERLCRLSDHYYRLYN